MINDRHAYPEKGVILQLRYVDRYAFYLYLAEDQPRQKGPHMRPCANDYIPLRISVHLWMDRVSQTLIEIGRYALYWTWTLLSISSRESKKRKRRIPWRRLERGFWRTSLWSSPSRWDYYSVGRWVSRSIKRVSEWFSGVIEDVLLLSYTCIWRDYEWQRDVWQVRKVMKC